MAESMARPEQKEWFPISLQALAELSGLSVATVKRTIPSLENVGLILVKSGVNNTGKQARNLYQIAETREAHGELASRLTVSHPKAHGELPREAHGEPPYKEKEIEGGAPPSAPPLHKEETGQAKPRPPLDGGTSLPKEKTHPVWFEEALRRMGRWVD